MSDRSLGHGAGIGRRGLLLSAGVTGAALGLGIKPTQAAEPKVLRVGTFEETNPTAILQASGWLEQATKAKVQWSNVGSGGAFNTLAAAGGIDVGLGLGTSPAAAGLSVGIPYKIVAMCDNIAGAEEMTVRKAAHISKPQDFVGKTVAVPFGSTSNFRLARIPQPQSSAWQGEAGLYVADRDGGGMETRRDRCRLRLASGKEHSARAGGEVYETYKELDEAGYVIGDLIR